MVSEKIEEIIKKRNLPKPRVYHVPTELDRLYESFEGIGVGPRYIRHYRKGEWHLELGGPKHEYSGFVFAEIFTEEGHVEDGKIELIGPEVNELPEESTFPFGLVIKVYAPWLLPEHSILIERFAYAGITFLEGMMINGTRATSWIRISKKMAPKLSFQKIGQSIRSAVITQAPVAEGVEIKWIISTPEMGGRAVIEEMLKEMFPVWWAVDAKIFDLKDSDVDTLYSCTICRMIAPNHLCIVTPEIMPFCGLFNYMGAEVIYTQDPSGYFSSFPRGEVIDADLGWFSGVDEYLPVKSFGAYKHFFVHSVIKYPMTNCGCMEAAVFYIPEVDGLGVIPRRYPGLTPLGIPFSTIAKQISGGIQNHGFKGICVQYMRFPSFVKGDGGWNRIVWMPKTLKQEVADAIPEEIYEKIATEEDATDPKDLKEFLKQKKHPIIEKFWKEGEPVPIKVPPPGADWPGY